MIVSPGYHSHTEIILEQTIVWENVSNDFVPPTFELNPIPPIDSPPSTRPTAQYGGRQVRPHSPQVRGFESASYYRRLSTRSSDPEIRYLASLLCHLTTQYISLTSATFPSLSDIDQLCARCQALHTYLTSLLEQARLRHNPPIDCSDMSSERIQFELNSDRLMASCRRLSEHAMTQLMHALVYTPDTFDSLLTRLLNPEVILIACSSDDDDIDSSVYDSSDNL